MKTTRIHGLARIWIAAAALPLALSGQGAPVPADPHELVTDHAKAVTTEQDRLSTVQLIERARSGYRLRDARRGYDLKVSFVVNSGGQTRFDGTWAMEDVFAPGLGWRWTATAGSAYSITRIAVGDQLYGEETASYVPLRLHEVRAALFDPIPAAALVRRSALRTAAVQYKGDRLTCVLLSEPGSAGAAVSARRWDETEECFDAQTGLLRSHSQVPGRFYVYNYAPALRLGDRGLPRKVIVTEGGKTVTEISLDSLTELNSPERTLFTPTAAMRERGRAITLEGARKLWQTVPGSHASSSGAASHTVCVFGVITPAGKLAEAHSLQPSDPKSQAAVDAAKRIDFSRAAPQGAFPQQQFAFVFEQFVPAP
jgi:hypothetical protein